MNEIMSQFLTSEVQAVLFVLLGMGFAFRCPYCRLGGLLHDSPSAS